MRRELELKRQSQALCFSPFTVFVVGDVWFVSKSSQPTIVTFLIFLLTEGILSKNVNSDKGKQ